MSNTSKAVNAFIIAVIIALVVLIFIFNNWVTKEINSTSELIKPSPQKEIVQQKPILTTKKDTGKIQVLGSVQDLDVGKEVEETVELPQREEKKIINELPLDDVILVQ